jgi:peptide/nickel transport system permease protein
MSAYLMLTGLMFVIINFVVDLLYQLVDPRLRGQPDPTAVSAT